MVSNLWLQKTTIHLDHRRRVVDAASAAMISRPLTEEYSKVEDTHRILYLFDMGLRISVNLTTAERG